MGGGASKKTADGEVLVAEGLVHGDQSQAAEAAPQQPAAPQQSAAPQPQQPEEDAQPPSAPKSSPERPKGSQEVKRPRVAKKGSAKLKDEAATSSGDQKPKEGTKEDHKAPLSSDDDSIVEETRAEAQAKAGATTPAEAGSEVPAVEEVPQGPPREITVEDLLAGCREGNADLVQAFLTTKARGAKGLADYEEALFDAYGDSVLHHAAHSGSEKVVQLLLDLGKVQVDIPNARNETALQIACRRGNNALVNILLQAGAEPNRQDGSGLTPFLSAVFAGANEELLESLAKATANVSAQDARGVGALHFGALRGDPALLDWLLKHKANVDMQTEHCTTPLMLAAKRGNTDCVSTLLNNRASTALADEAGCTALMQALAVGNDEAAKRILKAGASVDAIDCAGRSALFHAVLGGSLEALKAVLECGGRVNILDEEGRSPLYQACLMSADDLVKCLLAAEADPNLAGRGTTVRPVPHAGGEEEEEEDAKENHAARACLEEARTCLQVCATLAHNSILTSLLEQKADINAAPGALGWTALHLCAAVSNEEGATLLLANGALTALEDAEGNTAAVLAERAGHESVHAKIKEAAEKEPQQPVAPNGAPSPAARRNNPLRGSLPPLHAGVPDPEPPEEELEPLAVYKEAWEQRRPDGSLLDRVFGPMVHDAMRSDQWRDRWEALTYLSKNFSEACGSPADVVSAISEILANASRDKVPKVFLASLGVFEELLSDARADVLGPEEFTALLRGQQSEQGSSPEPCCDALLVLLDQTDAHGGSSAAASPQQAAADALCSCITNGRVPLDEAAWPLLTRIDDRLRIEAAHDKKDRKEAALAPKCLAANLKLLGRWLSAFGLQQSGLFRRALVLPLLLRAVASEHSKARAAAGDALVQLMALSGGLEERIWNLLPSKARKAVQRLASGQEGVSLLSAVPCEEDAMAKGVIVSEDERAGAFLCVSELNPQVWASVAAGEKMKSSNEKSKTASSAKAAVANAAAATPHGSKASESGSYGVADDAASEALQQAFASKNWKDRVESIATLARELASAGDGVKLVEDTVEGSGGGPLLSQYVLRGHRISVLQASLSTLLGDVVTAVFVAAADLLRLICGHVPLYIAPLFLEPLLLPLVARLLDTSGKVRAKSSETTLEVAALHGGALSEMIAQCVASGSAWSSAAPPQTSTGSGSAASSSSAAHGRDCDRSTGPRLHLLVQLVKQVSSQDSAGKWTDETWKALAEYAMRAAEHRNGDVRKEAAALLNSMVDIGDRAGAVADHAVAQLQALAQQRMCKRPGTQSTRPTTNSTRLGTASRPGSNAGSAAGLNNSGRLSTSQRLNTSCRSLASSGFTLNMNSTGRLSTASRSRTGGTGSSFRPRTGSSLRPGTGMRERDIDEESDNSIPEESAQPEPPVDGGDTAEGGVKFIDVQNSAAVGANEVPELAEGEQALREALPLAEALDEVALDFVAPLIALFGDGWTRCFYSRNWQCRVAALTHLSSSMSHRLEEITGPEVSPNALGELLDGAMRAVHEGLGDQNVKVYAEACLAVTAVVPAFCGTVDGRLLVAHLAPLLRQLCARMGDSKEIVRMQTVQALFLLLHPPTGNIVSPVAVAMLILRHLAPAKEEGGESPASIAKGGAGKGAATGWLCRLGALRDLCKEYSKVMVFQPGATTPGEWLRLKDGLVHGDPTVRYETARLYTLVCKMHLKCLGDEEAQKPGREAWVAALPKDTPPKSMIQVRRLLKLPEHEEKAEDEQPSMGGTGKLARTITAPLQTWEVPENVALWAGCKAEVLRALRFPNKGDEKAVIGALRMLGKAVCAHTDAAKRGGAGPDEAFAAICKGIAQALASPVGADRSVFLCAVDLCQTSVAQLAPVLSGLDINMSLAKLFPTLMERTSTTGGVDVKIGVASDKLVQQLAKHPKVGAEAVTKMVISSISRMDTPIRPLVLLRTLLSDFGLRLCAQRDVVMLMLGAVGIQLERVGGNNPEQGTENESLRTQLVGVLATCNQFSAETVHYCMSEVEPAHRKLIQYALAEAPNPKLVALGATAAEQETAEVAHVAGSAVRAASRSRGMSPKPGHDGPDMSPMRRSTGQLPGTELRKSSSRPGLPRAEDGNISRSASTRALGEQSPMREASPRSRRNRHRVIDASPPGEASAAASSADCAPVSSNSPRRHQAGGSSSSSAALGGLDNSQRSVRWGNDSGGSAPARPPAPMGLSTALSSGATYKFREGEAEDSNSRSMKRVGSSDGRFLKSKEKSRDDSLGAIMDVLAQMDNSRTKTR